MEVNPLLVNGDRIEALDVLIITEPDGAGAGAGLERGATT
jgi:hypothetical protein